MSGFGTKAEVQWVFSDLCLGLAVGRSSKVLEAERMAASSGVQQALLALLRVFSQAPTSSFLLPVAYAL